MKRFLIILLLTVSAFGQIVNTPKTSKVSAGSVQCSAFTPSNIIHKKVWEVGRTYGDFFFEIDVKPETPNQLAYFASDGDAGLHNILAGFQSNDTQFTFTGNLPDAAGVITFSPSLRFNLGQWYRFAENLHGNVLTISVNGKVIHQQTYNGVRKTLPGSSDGNFYICGSHHNNPGANIARMRLLEGASAYDFDYAPDKVFDKYIKISAATYLKANLVADYTAPSEFFADTGIGLDGDRHDGTFSAYTPETPMPTFERGSVDYSDVATHTVPPIPANALAFDSFNRADITGLTSSVMRLGYTDGGSLGQLEWQAPFGWSIIGEYAFAQYNQYYNNALQFDRTDVDLRVSRLPNSSTGLLLRQTDNANLIVVSGSNSTVSGAIFVNSIPTYFQFSSNSNWTTLRAKAEGNLLTIYADSTQVGQVAIPASLNGTKHGLRYAGNISSYKNFTAFPVN